MKASALVGLSTLLALAGLPAMAAAPAAYAVSARAQDDTYVATGTIQAVRQGTLGAQLSGRVLEVLVRSGEAVKAGQPLIRLDGADAVDAATASQANASGAAARLATARADHDRALQLRAADYISVAALQRSESALRSAEADAQATGAAASSARTRANWRTVTAPYSGYVTDLFVTAGDLASPGKPLLSLYDPAALRVIAQVPESIAAQLQASQPVLLAAATAQAQVRATSWAAVSAVDAATHSVEVRAELPAGTGLHPGQFAQLLLPLKSASAQMRIPSRAVLHRSEVTAVYVVDAGGAAHLRQVRLGPTLGDEVSVLSGLQAGEQIALDPIAAGRN
jgi:RND family efflux transporter MFP subunit